jgi:hypothetical protein
MLKLVCAVLFFSTWGLAAQNVLNGELKAYMYHVVKKSPILNENIGRYFEYSGPEVLLRNGEVNYDSLDVLISNFPNYLFIRSSEIAKCSPGIVAELANKTAIWELNRTLLAYLSDNAAENLRYQNHFEQFEQLLIEHLPSSQVKNSNSGKTFSPKLKEVLNPSIGFNVKRDLLIDKPGMNVYLVKEILEALNKTTAEWVQKRSFDIFTELGARTTQFENILLAGGDGSITSGLLNEREKDGRGRFDRGLPRAIGFFPYQIEIKSKSKGGEQVLPIYFPSIDLFTAGSGRITNLHPDIWGYNDKKQTTLVIEKNKRQYVLFGSAETRFLSPDSSFNESGTFMSIINELEKKHIAELKEMIHGKQGFDYWIAFNEEQLQITKKEIIDVNQALHNLRSSNARNSKKGKRKLSALQTKFINKQNHYDRCEDKIKKLTKEKAEASEKLDLYESRLALYKKLIGNQWMPYTRNIEGLFTFEDGATFDIKTQDFRFPPSFDKEYFEVRLLPVPFSALSDQVDEVMLHLTLSDMKSDFDQKFNLDKVDWFASNAYTLKSSIFSEADSVVVYDLLKAISEGIKPVFQASGMGIGVLINDSVVKQNHAEELNNYPGETPEERKKAQESDAFKLLRKTIISVDLNKELIFKIESFTDPVRATFEPQNSTLNKQIQQTKTSKNDALSVYRTASVLMALKNELIQYAGLYLPREEAVVSIETLESAFKKIVISYGKHKIQLSDLNL